MKNAKFQSDIIKQLIKDGNAENINAYIDKVGAWISLDRFCAAYIKRDEFYISLAALASSKESDIFEKVARENTELEVVGYYTGQDVNAFVSNYNGNKKFTLALIQSETGERAYIDKSLIKKYWDLEEVTFLFSSNKNGPLLIKEGEYITGLIMPVNWHMD